MDCCMIYANVSTAVGGEKLASLCLLASLSNHYTCKYIHKHTSIRTQKLKSKAKAEIWNFAYLVVYPWLVKEQFQSF